MVIMTNNAVMETKQKQHIMVIQNDLNMHELLNDGLILDGYDIIIAEDEDEALRLLDHISPDMVIMDTVTADAHSLHILDSVKEKSDAPMIIIAADNEMETLKEMFDHGADDLVYKPINMHVLVARIHAILRRWYPFHQELFMKEFGDISESPGTEPISS